MTAEEALTTLGASTADAVAHALGLLAPDSVEHGAVTVLAADADPLDGVTTPAVATSVSYVDGVTGGNVFVLTRTACRRLAAAMMGSEPEESDEELSELELSAVSEAMNQMMAAAAAATSGVLGQEVEISTPTTQVLDGAAPTDQPYARTPHATSVGFLVFGEPCRLVQLVPNAFVVRMGRALSEREGEVLADTDGDGAPGAFGGDVIRGVGLRMWAELGRARLPVGRAVGLSRGSVLELDRGADDPVDLFVNGRRVAVGRLLLTSDGEWAVEIEQLFAPETSSRASLEGVR